MEFSRQEYWSGLPFPSTFLTQGSNSSLVSPALAGGFYTTVPSGKILLFYWVGQKFVQVFCKL